jgi:hypothetical protein
MPKESAERRPIGQEDGEVKEAERAAPGCRPRAETLTKFDENAFACPGAKLGVAR